MDNFITHYKDIDEIDDDNQLLIRPGCMTAICFRAEVEKGSAEVNQFAKALGEVFKGIAFHKDENCITGHRAGYVWAVKDFLWLGAREWKDHWNSFCLLTSGAEAIRFWNEMRYGVEPTVVAFLPSNYVGACAASFEADYEGVGLGYNDKGVHGINQCRARLYIESRDH